MTVTGERLIASVRAHAAKSPNFTYEPGRAYSISLGSCVYVLDGKPSCLIGHALWDADLINADLEHDNRNDCPFRDLAFTLDLDISAEEKQWLIDVQNFQDQTQPWGECVVGADRAALERILAEGI